VSAHRRPTVTRAEPPTTDTTGTTDVWAVLSTARTIRRFTDDPVDDATLARCLEAATWAPNGANAQAWRFVVLRSPEMRAVVETAAARALEVIEPVYGMSRPADGDDSRRARNDRATYELHDRAGEFTSVLFTQKRFPTASELLLGGSIYPAMQNFLLAARAQGLGACMTSWASYGGEALLRDAVGVPDDWMLAGHVVVGWPRGRHGPVRRRPLTEVVFLDQWGTKPPEPLGGPAELEDL
jgi:nitroreductase